MKPALRSLSVLCLAATGFAVGRLSDSPIPPDPTKPAPASAPPESTPAAHDPVASILSAFVGGDRLHAMARAQPQLAELSAEQWAALMARAERMDRTSLCQELFSLWIERDPEAATAWFRPRLLPLSRDPYSAIGFQYGSIALLATWSELLPVRALEFARQFPKSGAATIVLRNAVLHWRGKSVAERFAILREFPGDGVSQSPLVTLCAEWAEKDLHAAIAATTSLPPGTTRDAALGEVIAKWAEKDPVEALRQATTHGVTDTSMLAGMVHEAVKRDPAPIVKWLEEKGPDTIRDLGMLLVNAWVGKDPAAAFAWAIEHGISLTDAVAPPKGKSSGFSQRSFEMRAQSPLSSAMSNNRDATLRWLRSLPAGDERNRLIELALPLVRDLGELRALSAELPPEAGPRIARIITAAQGADPKLAQQYAKSLTDPASRAAAWQVLGRSSPPPASLPPGPDRDAMQSGHAIASSRAEPATALSRAMEIADLNLRRQTLGDIFAILYRGKVEHDEYSFSPGAPASSQRAAQEWLESATIPDEWKQKWKR